MLQFVECVYSGPLPAAVDLVIEHSLVCELVSTVLSHSRFFFLEGYGGSNWPCACEGGIGTTELIPSLHIVVLRLSGSCYVHLTVNILYILL